MRAGLILVGVLVLVGVYFAQSYFEGQAASSYGFISRLVSASTIWYSILVGYILGAVLLVLGISIPKHKDEIHIKVDNSRYDDEEEKGGDPIDILKKRYAKGEISKEKYIEMKHHIEDEEELHGD